MLKCVKEINKDKRFEATFSDGTKVRFGQTNPKQGTFIDHGDKKLKSNYIKRHLRDLRTNDYKRAGFLSLFLLWNKPSLIDSIHDYNRRIKYNDWEIQSGKEIKGNELSGGGTQFFCRIGSKLSLLDRILNLIPPHAKYVEAFVGGGAVYWNKEPADKAVLNDLDKDLIEGYKLLKSMKNRIPSDFPIQVGINKIQKLVDKPNPTKEERLLQILYSTCNTFSFSRSNKIYSHNTQITKINKMKDFVDRMKNTTITNQDYKIVLRQHDSPNTFFFLDPPYEEESDKLYNDFFIDYEEMNQLLKSLKGNFLLTINDSPKIRNIFKGFIMQPIIVKGRPNTPIGGENRKELFIMNYTIH